MGGDDKPKKTKTSNKSQEATNAENSDITNDPTQLLMLNKLDEICMKIVSHTDKTDDNRRIQTELQLKAIQTEFNLKFETLKTTHSLELNALKTAHNLELETLRKEIFDINQKVDKSNTEKVQFNATVSDLKSKIQTLETDVDSARYDADDMQVCSNRPYLVVNNFKPVGSKTDTEAFVEFCNDKMSAVSVTISGSDIEKLVRIKHNRTNIDSTKAEIMIVKFKQETLRDTLFRNKRRLARSGTTFTELLPPRRKQLLNKCIQDLPTENRSIWTDGGKVLVAYDNGSNNITHIKTAKDIEQLKLRLFRSSPTIPSSD